MYAAQGGHLEVVRILLHSGASVSAANKAIREDGGGGSQPLHFAMIAKSLPVVEELIAAGADPNAVGSYGHTPLVVAIYAEFLEGIRFLLTHGANLRLKPRRKDFVPPLCAAADLTKRDSAALLNASAPCARFRSPEVLPLLLDAGADPNATDALKRTPLIWLAWQPDLPDDILTPLMEALIKAGAKVDQPDRDGGTALEAAVLRNNPSAVRHLLKAGANANQLFLRGTPLDIAEQDAATFQQQLANTAFVGPAREVVAQKLQQAKAAVEVLRECGAKRKTEL
jgi:ankyrin repeat protein